MNPSLKSALNERRLHYLYEAVTVGSLRAAADKLDLNASVLSRQIAQLEAELSVPLLERQGRGVRPTEAGRLLVDFHRQHSTHQDDLIAKLDEIRGLSRGQIDVVIGEGFVDDLLGEPLRSFWQRHPNLTVSLDLAGTNEVVRRVTDYSAQIGLVYSPPRTPEIRSRAVSRHPLCAIVRRDHPLARARSVRLAELTAHPIAEMTSAYGVQQLLEMAQHAERVQLVPTLTTNSMLVLRHFVSAGTGVMMLPAFAVAREIDEGRLVAVPIDQALLASAEAHVITRQGRQLSGAANSLLQLLIATMRTFRPPRGKAR